MDGFDLTEFAKGFEAAHVRVADAAARGLGLIAEQILANSQELCPVSPTDPNHAEYTGHSGALRDSGTVKDAEIGTDKISVEIGYNTNYAAAVHERLEANHRYPGAVNPNAQAKFLEVPLRNAATEFLPKLRDMVREELGK